MNKAHWSYSIIKCLVLIIGGLATLAVVVFGYIMYNFGDIQEANYRESQEYYGQLSVLQEEFRRRFHGKTDYPPSSLAKLIDEGVFSDGSVKLLKTYKSKYVPFVPSTPESQQVLRFGGVPPDVFTKGDLTAAPAPPYKADAKAGL